MHILVLGAAGMVGRKLTERLLRDGRLGKTDITRMTLQDVVEPAKPANAGFPVETIAGDSIVWLEGQCSSYGGEQLYWPFVELFRRWIGVEPGEAEISLRTKLRAKLASVTALDEHLHSCEHTQRRWHGIQNVRRRSASRSRRTRQPRSRSGSNDAPRRCTSCRSPSAWRLGQTHGLRDDLFPALVPAEIWLS